MASLASSTVFWGDKTRMGTGKYCRAVSDTAVGDGDVKCMDMGSLRMELGDSGRERWPMAK